jgi:hypothetical protein
MDSFLASDPAYHGDPALWFFASNRSIQDQMEFVYDGYVSSFVCRYPDFLKVMPHAVFFGCCLAILIFYLLFRSFSFNLKTLCAIPTFLVLLGHVMVYEPWNIERWDFFPFFIMYFIVAGYNTKTQEVKNNIKVVLSLVVFLSFFFTFSSFNLLCGFHESPAYAYSDKLGTLMGNNSTAIETVLDPVSSAGLYLKYECGNKVIFVKKIGYNISDLKGKEIYTSNSSFKNMPKIFPDVKWHEELIWLNKIDKNISIIKIKPQNMSTGGEKRLNLTKNASELDA